MRKTIFLRAVVLLALAAGCKGAAPSNPTETQTPAAKAGTSNEPPEPPNPLETKPVATQAETPPPTPQRARDPLPDFIFTVRGYGGGGYDDFQCETMQQLGIEYVEGLADFAWQHIEPQDDVWKWEVADAQMDLLSECGLKTIAFLIIPKLEGLHWDESIRRDDPRVAVEYEEFAYELVHRYHTHTAWSGLVAAWGGSSDAIGESPFHEPEVVVPLQNAAYDGVKRADPDAVVIGFNMATTCCEGYGEWHSRAFALGPKFDWFGVQSHDVPTTVLESPDAFSGVVGLLNVRAFLDAHGYADRPIFLNEGGFIYGEDVGGLAETAHAEQVAETFIVARTLGVDLRGWVYFAYFGKTIDSDEGVFGLMSSLDEHDPPQPRLAWSALRALFRTLEFFTYQFETKLSREYNQPSPPFVYLFRREKPESRLWVVFSPRVGKVEPVAQDVAIDISPATQATLITMLGETSPLTADASGAVSVGSTSSPVYVRVED